MLMASGNGQQVWVKSAGTATVSGNGVTAWVENPADLTLSGAGSSVMDCDRIEYDDRLLSHSCP